MGAATNTISASPPARSFVPREELAAVIARDAALRESLLRHASSLARHHRQDAEDLFGTTLTRALDPAYASWDREQHETPVSFLMSVMNGLSRNAWRSSYMKKRADLDEHNPPAVAAPEADPERQIYSARQHQKRIDMEEALRARLADKPLAIKVLDGAAAGVKGNQDLATHIGCTVREVVAAKQMLREYGAIIRAERASEPGAA